MTATTRRSSNTTEQAIPSAQGWVDHDTRQLADQLRRCARASAARLRRRQWVDGLHRLAAGRWLSICALIALVAGASSLVA